MFSEKSRGPTIDERHEAKYGVQHSDAEEVPKRPEVRDAVFGINHVDLDGHQVGATPGGKDEQLQLGLVSIGEQGEARHVFQRIKPIARLCVGQVDACLHPEPEVGKLIGEGVLARHVVLFQVAAAHNQGAGVLLQSLHKQRDVFGEVLSVAVDGEGIVKAHGLGFLEALFEGIAFATVTAIVDHGDALAKRSQDFSRMVGAAVVDDDDIGTIGQHPFHHVAQRAAIVVGRHDDADLQLPHLGWYHYGIRVVHN